MLKLFSRAALIARVSLIRNKKGSGPKQNRPHIHIRTLPQPSCDDYVLGFDSTAGSAAESFRRQRDSLMPCSRRSD
jgi:hypothetical protein